jgi:hypothetical protein
MEPKNREQRRHPEKTEPPPRRDDPKHTPVDELLSPARTPDDYDVRAKSTGHGKKTADKWNQ